MTKSKKLMLCFILGLTSIFAVQAQTQFEVPQNVELKTKEDFAKYEPAMVEAAKWLEETDLDKELPKRKEVNAFILTWIAGSPTVNVEISQDLAKIYGKNVHLLGVYLASYARHCIENKDSSSKFSATKAGLISMMNVYKKGLGITKSKEMDKLIKLTANNKLDDYINDKFK